MRARLRSVAISIDCTPHCSRRGRSHTAMRGNTLSVRRLNDRRLKGAASPSRANGACVGARALRLGGAPVMGSASYNRFTAADWVVRTASIACRQAGAAATLFASFIYSGLQLCFIVFMTTQLTTVAGMDLVQAGRVLAAYQIAGILARPAWGWLADHVLAARWLLALQGAIMCGAALLAAQFGPGWPGWLVILVCACAGATASGFTGIAYGEYARLGGERRTEATVWVRHRCSAASSCRPP